MNRMKTKQDIYKNPEVLFENMKLTEAYKSTVNTNPLMTQRFGADPYVIVYEGRIYVYMTGDTLQYDTDGNVMNNTYGNIYTLNVISSDDMVNWTDHGSIYAASSKGAASWGNNSWAPAVCYKEINGITKFFIYFANSGNGIGVLTSNTPIGPFTDPIGKALISRDTPNCSTVTWLFDPAVLIDDDGKGYLYFGGGIPNEQYANPGTGRVVQLGEDMISLAGEPVALDIPYLFEDSGINKIGDTYYYSYCSNWSIDDKAAKEIGFKRAEIIYMTSKSPMGPFELKGPILKNPEDYFGCCGNNHHCMFKFQDQMYMAYHTQVLENRKSIFGGYRCTFIDKVVVNENGSIEMIHATEEGVKQYKALNPYERVEAETMATMGGISTLPCSEESIRYGSGNMAVTQIHTGDWIYVKGVDFGDAGAYMFTASVRAALNQGGVIQIKIDGLLGKPVGYLVVEPTENGEFVEVTVELNQKVCGVHDICFIFHGEGYEIDYWSFKQNVN